VTQLFSMAAVRKLIALATLAPCILSLDIDLASDVTAQSRHLLSSSSSDNDSYLSLDEVDEIEVLYHWYHYWDSYNDTNSSSSHRRLSSSSEGKAGYWTCSVAENMTDYADLLYSTLYDFSDECHSGHHVPDGVYLVLYFSFTLFIGCLLNYVFHRLHVPIPYTVVMLLMGCMLEFIEVRSEDKSGKDVLGELNDAFSQVRTIDPHMVLALFIPGLIFESAYSTSYHIFMKELPQAAMMAGPGVLVNTLLVGGFMRYLAESISKASWGENTEGYGWSWSFCFMFGTIVSATDPVAVVALLKELGASKRLSTLIEAESLLNDGSAFVFFMIFKEYSKSAVGTSVGTMISMFFQLAVLGGLFGIFAGFVCCYILSQVFNDAEIEISVSIATVYLFSFIGEYTFANVFGNDLGVSGVLVVVLMGLWVSKNREAVSPHVEEAMHHFWEMVGFIANTLLFFITGQVIVYQLYTINQEDSTTFSWSVDLLITFLIWVFCHITRAMCIWMMFPVLKNTGYGCTFEEACIMVYGGLRGAIGLAMALIVVDDTGFDEQDRQRVLFHVSLFVMATLVVNASTIKYMVEYFGLNKPPLDTAALFKSATQKLLDHTHERLKQMKNDKHYVGADWAQVNKLQPDYKQLFRDLYDMKFADEVEKDQDELSWNQKDDQDLIITMIALLQKETADAEQRNAVEKRVIQVMKSSYWAQYEHGLLSADAVNILVEASEQAMDDHDLSLQQKLLGRWFEVPWYVKWMHKSSMGCIKNLSDRFLFNSLGFSVEVASGFDYAAKEALTFCQVLKKGDTVQKSHLEYVDAQLNECSKWIQKTSKDLERNYPEVHTAIQTKFAAQNLLTYQKEQIEHLLHKGFFDEAEHGRVLGHCESSLTELFHTSYTELLGQKADAESIYVQSPLFSDLTEGEKKIALEQAKKSEFFDKGHVLMKKGEKGWWSKEEYSDERALFVITAGAISVMDANEQIHLKERGECLDVYPLLQDNAHDFDFEVASKNTTGYWLNLGVLKLLKDSNVNFYETIWRAAAAEMIRYYFSKADVLAGVDLTDLDNMVHNAPLHFYDASDQDRAQIRVSRGLGVLLNGQVVHITNMNTKAEAPAILPVAEDPYLAIEDAVVLNLDLHRSDYHSEKTNHLNPKLAAIMGVKAASVMPDAREESYDDYDDEDYVSGEEMASDPEESPGPNGMGRRADEEEDMALLDDKETLQKPDLKVLAVDSSNGANAEEEEKAKEEPATKGLKKSAGGASKRVSRHKSTSALRKERFSYQLEDDVLPNELMDSMRGLTVKQSFEVLKVVLAKHENLFDDLKKFHIIHVQQSAKMQIKVSGASKANADPDTLRNGAGGGSLFARPSAHSQRARDPSVSRSGLRMPQRRRNSTSKGRMGGSNPFHHEPSATPIIIKPSNFAPASNLRPEKSDAEYLKGGWTDKSDEDVVDLNGTDVNNAME